MAIQSLWRGLQVCSLNVQAYLRQVGEQLDRTKNNDDGSNALTLDRNAKLEGSKELEAETLNWYRTKLQKSPYWAKGHLRVGEIAFGLGDINVAYAAIQGVMQLTHQGELHKRARHLLGKIYLSSRAFEKALGELVPLHEENPKDPRISEDLAATYMAEGRLEDAYRLLKTVEESTLSQEGVAAFQYLKQKLN